MDDYSHIINMPPEDLFEKALPCIPDTDDGYIPIVMAANLNHQAAIELIIGTWSNDKFPLNPTTQTQIDFLEKTQTYAWSATLLARAYRDGTLVPINYEKAIELFNIGITNKCCIAPFSLAYMYKHGLGVEKNYSTAAELYIASDDFLPAMYQLSKLYLKGKGIEQDESKAIGLLEAAAKRNHLDSMYKLAMVYENRNQYTEAIRIHEMAVKLNDINAIVNLALIYHNGTGVNKDYARAIELYDQGVALNDPDSMFNLALLYCEDDNPNKNYAKAAELYELAVKLGDSDAILNLAIMYHEGVYIEQNLSRAIELYNMAIELDNLNAQFNLGLLYGYTDAKDLTRAENLFKIAHDAGDPGAFNALLCLYLNNLTEFDPEKIVEYILEKDPNKLTQIFTEINIIEVLQTWRQCKNKLGIVQGLLDEQVLMNRQLTDHINLVPDGPEYLELLNGWNKKIDKLT